MASFERYDVVRVPFPFTDRQAEKNRPARLRAAAAALDDVVAVDPSEAARLHARLAEACFTIGQAWASRSWRA